MNYCSTVDTSPLCMSATLTISDEFHANMSENVKFAGHFCDACDKDKEIEMAVTK